ncbi:MAG: histidine--tRNA ligase [Chloroflexi bacterium]|nr:histidine--tRNA ligase [Chloroflexota bacterium]
MFKAPRGTVDLLPQEQRYWRYAEQAAAGVCRRFGYQRLDTPTFEASGLFVRGVGEQTDIVQKEMYTFEDRGGDLVTLRPEGTAPACRAYLEHGMSSLPQPVRLYYFCPIFRYERPQAGRYREHHQFGVEAIGDGDPAIDAEVIQLGWSYARELGLGKLSLVVNSIGDPACRPGYLQALKEYYGAYLPHLCQDCRGRYERNPLRLLDCKQERCQPFIASAPRSSDHLCDACKEHWRLLLAYLDLLGIPYTTSHRLVRGLDYYTRTVFEIQPPDEGGQSTLLGGGRYDGLVQELGGPPTPGIGFGSGFERMVLNLKRQEVRVPEVLPRPVVIVHNGPQALEYGLGIAARLRKESLTVIVAPAQRSLRAQMRYASSVNARYAVVVGETEVRQRTGSVRDMDNASQEEAPEADLAAYLVAKVGLEQAG